MTTGGEADSYDAKAEGEAQHWASYAEAFLSRGIPRLVDLRRGVFFEPLPGFIRDTFYDPRLDEIWLGKERGFVMERAAHRGGRVLDVCCGSGWLSLELGRRGLDVTGIDLSQGAINIARRFLEENPYKDGFGSVNYHAADLNQVELEPASFDTVVVWGGLHHIKELDRLLDQIRHALKPNGEFIVWDHDGVRRQNLALIFLSCLVFLFYPSFFSLSYRLRGLTTTFHEQVIRRTPFSGIAEKIFRKLGLFFEQGTEGSTPLLRSVSPFEGVGSAQIIPSIERCLKVTHYERRNAFGRYVVSQIRLKRDRSYRMVGWLKRMDDWLACTRLFPGDNMLLVARKEESP